MIEKVELKVESFIDEKYTEVSIKRRTLEEEIKESRLEIESLEKQIKELEEKKDEAFDVFQAVSTEEDPIEEERKALEDKIESLYNSNTERIANVKIIDKEIKRISEIRDELSVIKKKLVINDLKEEESEKVITKEELLKEAAVINKDNKDDKDNKDNKEETDNKANQESQDDTANNKDLDLKNTNEKENVSNYNSQDNNDTNETKNASLENKAESLEDKKILIERLKFVKSIIGKDNQRATTALLQIIKKLGGK